MNLKGLNLSFCYEVSDETIKTISEKLKNLQKINLTSCDKIGDLSILYLNKNCKNIYKITLNGTKITDTSLQYLSSFSNLNSLFLSRCYFLTDNGFSLFCEKSQLKCDSSLNKINISGCKNLTKKTLKLLLKNFPFLFHLEMAGISGYSEKLVSFAPSLRVLSISGDFITEFELLKLLEKSSNLEILNLGTCNFVNQKIVECISSNIPKLIHLNLSNSELIDDKCIEILSIGCKNIVRLNLVSTKVTRKSLDILMKHFRELSLVSLSEQRTNWNKEKKHDILKWKIQCI